MPDLTPEIVDAVLAACQAGAEEAGEALSRALDMQVTVSVGQSGSLDMDALPDELSGPGLAVVLVVGDSGALLLLPESSGLVPEWCADPDPTGQSKLTTLAQELGMLVLPEQFMPEDFQAARVKNLAGALKRGEVGQGAGVVPLELSADDKRGTAHLIWPAAKPAAVLGSLGASPQPEPKPAAEAKLEPEPAPAVETQPEGRRREACLRDLPSYARSLLRIKVPVVVTLAEERQPLGRVVEVAPGSIIQFDKPCDEALELAVGEHPIAKGEAVKVGDKFGLRVTSIILPEERFHPVKREIRKHTSPAP